MNEKGFNFPIQLSVCEKKTLVMNSELKMEDIVHSSLKKTFQGPDRLCLL